MTTLAARPKPISTAEMPPEFRELPSLKPDRMARPKAWARRHRRTLAWLLPILVGAGLVNAINLAGSPQQIDDEGTYTAQAWSVLNLGQLTHYTYWYDHPPLGWIQIAAWTGLTDGFGRYSIAVIAGREAMIVAMLASVAVLWFLARRIGFSRGAAAAATIIFAVSPLAVQFHRTVYLDNVATPWLLGAILLAMTKRRQLLGFAAAAACLGIAVLSKETYLLALPLVGWLMWRNARPETRRYTLAVAVTILVLFGFSYVLLALVKGELFPSSHHTSLIAGVEYQLATRSPSGSLFNPHSLMNKTIGEWFQLDPVQVVVAPLAGIGGLFIRRLRPFAIALLALVLFMFRPGGYLPVPYVIMLLPLSAIVIAGVGEWAVRSWRSRPGTRRLPNIAIAILTLGALVVAVPAWGSQLRGLLLANLDGTTVQAETWVEKYVPKDSRVIVDDSMWVDFVEHGFARDNVIWFYKLDTDSAVKAQSPQGWKDSDYVISTESMRTSPDAASADDAIANSEVVASFGTGTQLVQVRRIEPEGVAKARAVNSSAASVRASTGQAVAQNPQLTSSAQDIARLKAGQVDPRISLALGQLLADGAVTVSGLPKIAGEGGDLFRQVDLRSVDGSALVRDGSLTAEGRMVVESLSGAYAPEYHSVTSSGLRLTFSIVPPADLIQ
jgi:Dolichyl-phosphate-mannose-protein mannosyltransferase